MSKDGRSELARMLWSQASAWRAAVWLSLVSGVLALTPSVYMLEVYERVVNSRNVNTLLMLTVITLAAYFIMEWLSRVRARLVWAIGVRFDLALSKRVYDAMMQVMSQTPDVNARSALDDQRTVREFFQSPALSGLMELPVALVAAVLLYLISPWLALAAALGAVLQVGVAGVLQWSTRKPMDEAQQQRVAAQAYAEASLRNAQVMESMGMLGAVMGHWQQRQRRFLLTQVGASETASGLNAATKVLQQLMGTVLLGLSAWLLLHNDLNGGAAMLIVSSILGGRLLSPLTQMVSQWRQWVQFSAAWRRLSRLLAAVPAPEAAMPLPPPSGQLEVTGLAGGAPGQAPALVKGVKFALRPGQVMAVLGASGSGKTSLARLLIGVWRPSAGKVRLSGVDLHQWDKRELGPHLGYLPQNIELLDGTVAENICRFGALDGAKVEAAARAVGLHEMIMDLPQGYDTPVGRDGALLSGGQRQRMGLARALYGQPVLVVLDEPNASLDEAGDRALMQAIRAASAAGTSFVIMTHRRGVLDIADVVLVMQAGAQVTVGPRDEVLRQMREAAAKANTGQASPAAVAQGAAS